MKSFVILVLLGLGASQSDSPPPPPENLTTDIPTPPASDIPTVTQDIPTPPPIEDTETPAVPFTSEADLPDVTTDGEILTLIPDPSTEPAVPETPIPTLGQQTSEPFPPTTEPGTTAPAVLTEILPTGTTDTPITERRPRISIHPRNITVARDSSARFYCAAKGSPSPHLVIVRADSDYQTPKFFEDEDADSQTYLGDVEVNQILGPITDSDEGWWECIAANYYGIVKSRAYLRVMDLCGDMQCKAPKKCVQDYDTSTAGCQCPELVCTREFEPVCGADCQVHFNPCVWNQTSCENDYDSSTIIGTGPSCPQTTDPFIELLDLQDVEIMELGEFSLSCNAGGYPAPSVEWFKIAEDGTFLDSVGKGEDLTLQQVSLSASGYYVARATNCQTNQVNTRAIRVDVIPLPVPTETPDDAYVEKSVCAVFGDPHIITFDQHKFHFAGACTYILSMECERFSWFIYGLFSFCGLGTCLEEITIFIDYEPVVLSRGWIIFKDGAKHQYIEGTKFELGGIEWSFDGLILTGRHDGHGLTIMWDGFVSLQIALDDSFATQTCGVCGNNDNAAGNEHMQSTKLEEKLIESNQPSVYVDNWKIDREKVCVMPQEVVLDTLEPCGTNFKKNREALEACQQLVENRALMRCVDAVDIKFYYESCLYDFCYMGLLRPEEGPFPGDKPVILPECTIGRAYASHCELEGVDVGGWDVYMDQCDRENTQDAIISTSCYQEILPFFRFRK